MPQDHFLLVVAHEVFGHGARFRELGDGRLRYGFDAPIPYGSGDAFTRFNGRFPISPLADLNVSAAGIDAQHALADAIAERAVARGRMHYREAWLYFESRIAAVSYILSASPTSSEGHDVADFLETFEKACTAPCSPLTRNDVQRRALLALVDPLLYYSMYGLAVSYIGNGSTTGPMPLIPVGGGVRLMPSLGYALAPYGAEWTFRTAFQQEQRAQSRERRITNVALRVGNTGASSTWGLSARAADVLRVRRPSHRRWPSTSGGSRSCSPIRRLTRSIWAPAPSQRSSCRCRDCCDRDGRTAFRLRPATSRRAIVPGEQLSGGGVVRAGIALR